MVKLEKCKTCGFNPASSPMGALHKNNPIDVNMVKEYCERTANSNQTITPIWRKCCGYLERYNVILEKLDKPLWNI